MSEQDEDRKAAEEWAVKEFPPTDFKNQYNWQLVFMEQTRTFLAGVAYARRWIPVTERLPEVGLEVVFRDDKGCIRTGNLYEESLEKFAFGDGCECCSAFNTQKITHWMPLPPEPKEEA